MKEEAGEMRLKKKPSEDENETCVGGGDGSCERGSDRCRGRGRLCKGGGVGNV